MAIFDTHAHYVKNDFGEALHPLLSSMSEAGVEKIMAVGYDLDSSREEMQLAEQYPFVWAAVGVHPENCEGLPADWLGQLAGMLSSPRVKALGEIGLDRHYEGCDKVLQAEVFERQLQLAKTLDVPVIIHSRDACEDTMELLRKYKPAGVMHCFSYSPEIAEEVGYSTSGSLINLFVKKVGTSPRQYRIRHMSKAIDAVCKTDVPFIDTDVPEL